MTDNEIIKALECHASDAEFCKLCPLTNEEWCSVKLARNTLDLINRKDSKIAELTEENNHQQAEIERLKQNLEEAHIDIREHLSEIERLQKLLDGAEICIDELEYALDKVGHSNSRVDDALEKYNNLVEEMVGETK